MSDPVTKVEIEDVLSSIRKLVSEDARGAEGERSAPESRADGPEGPSAPERPTQRPDRLVLGPALRVDAGRGAEGPLQESSGAPVQDTPQDLPSEPVLLTDDQRADTARLDDIPGDARLAEFGPVENTPARAEEASEEATEEKSRLHLSRMIEEEVLAALNKPDQGPAPVEAQTGEARAPSPAPAEDRDGAGEASAAAEEEAPLHHVEDAGSGMSASEVLAFTHTPRRDAGVDAEEGPGAEDASDEARPADLHEGETEEASLADPAGNAGSDAWDHHTADHHTADHHTADHHTGEDAAASEATAAPAGDLESKIAALERLVASDQGAFDEDRFEEEDALSHRSGELDWPDHAEETGALGALEQAAEPSNVLQSRLWMASPPPEAAAPETQSPALSLDEVGLDEEMLRDMVAEIVRQELQGALGERITRNVRKLVRREIHRMLITQELD